jgi:[acyl-carrier-protein] S-malonyltransferase
MRTGCWNWINKIPDLADENTAFIFPAFISNYRDDPSGSVPVFRNVFNSFLERASSCTGIDLSEFHPESNPMLREELNNQILSYIYGCSCAEILLGTRVKPRMLAGYSMGIYAALYAAGSIGFETGLLFIGNAYQAVRQCLKSSHYGMGTVIGLKRKDIEKIIFDHDLKLVIVNRNSEYSYSLAGDSFHINVFLLKAREEGALNTRSLGVSIPYHTGILKDAATSFARSISHLEIGAPQVPLISVLNREIIGDPGSARKELAENLFNSFDWLETQLRMYSLGIRFYIECGPSNSLLKNSRFIPGSGKFVVWSTLVKT